jgi:hypothetical protein
MGLSPLSFLLTGMMVCCNMSTSRAAEYIGSAACGKCHPQEFARQSESGHAQALHRATDHPLAKSYMASPVWSRGPTYQFLFSQGPDGFDVQVFDYATRQTLQLPVEWAFGAGNHAVTFVSRVSEDVYIEHAFSFYTDTKTMDLTPGHRLMQSDSLPKAVGVLHRVTDLQDAQGGMRKCFECHSTGPIQNTAVGIEPSEMGVRCEVCHGPGSAHRKAVMDGRSTLARSAIRNPSRMSADQINEMCGSCHRFPGSNFAVNWNAQWNVRHQPPYFRQSRCFVESQGRLSCFSCHAPHGALRKGDAPYYSNKCLACHTTPGHFPAAICKSNSSVDCISCHMPSLPVTSHLSFVNHWIGIYKSGDKLKPVQSPKRSRLSAGEQIRSY